MTSIKRPHHFDIITVFPEMWQALEYGVIHRAKTQGLWQPTIWQLRDFALKDDGRIDDRPYGGGPGMLMSYQPLANCLAAVQQQRPSTWVIQLDPAGEPLNHTTMQPLLQKQDITLICGRYEGIDQRFTDLHVDQCISIGPYVLSGGDLPAMMLVDALVRQLPGALVNEASKDEDSFQTWLLDHPHYTRPQNIANHPIPDVLKEGDHQAIHTWRRQQALGRTWMSAQLAQQRLTPEDIALLQAYMDNFIKNH